MKSIAVVSTDQTLNSILSAAVEAYPDDFEATFLDTHAAAIQHLNYELPQLSLLSINDPVIPASEMLRAMREDPWLHSGGIILVYDASVCAPIPAALMRLNVISIIEHHRLDFYIPRLLRILSTNDTILYQRDLHLLLGLNLSGGFVLDNDPFDLTTYSNLIANFLFNAGLLGAEEQERFHVALMELLINAIEHGNCRITYEEKSAWLETGKDPMELIRRKNEDPEINRSKVYLSYRIRPQESEFVIRDEGEGFDWRSYQTPVGKDGVAESHGRGIFMASHYLGPLVYNDEGNEVSFSIRHHDGGAQAVPELFADQDELLCRDGDIVFTEGEKSSHLYYIVSGQYEVIVRGRCVSTLSPADIFVGEMSFLLNNRRSATVRAIGHGRLLRVSKEQFINTIKEKPHYGIFLARLVAQRLVRLHQT